jgi:hypothetical protein
VVTFDREMRRLMRETPSSRIVGMVQLTVGDRVVSLPVHSVAFRGEDGQKPAGGFFVNGNDVGIVVTEGASAQDVQTQMSEACRDAVRHLSKRLLS